MSAAEMLLEAQLRQAGIDFRREYAFAAPRRRWRSDFVISDTRVLTEHERFWPSPRQLILIEIDGGAFVAGRHTRGVGFERDLEKHNAAALLGYRVLRFTPAMVDDGRALEVIREALGMERAA